MKQIIKLITFIVIVIINLNCNNDKDAQSNKASNFINTSIQNKETVRNSKAKYYQKFDYFRLKGLSEIDNKSSLPNSYYELIMINDTVSITYFSENMEISKDVFIKENNFFKSVKEDEEGGDVTIVSYYKNGEIVRIGYAFNPYVPLYDLNENYILFYIKEQANNRIYYSFDDKNTYLTSPRINFNIDNLNKKYLKKIIKTEYSKVKDSIYETIEKNEIHNGVQLESIKYRQVSTVKNYMEESIYSYDYSYH